MRERYAPGGTRPPVNCVCTYVCLHVCTCALLSSVSPGPLGDGAEDFNICKESGPTAMG